MICLRRHDKYIFLLVSLDLNYDPNTDDPPIYMLMQDSEKSEHGLKLDKPKQSGKGDEEVDPFFVGNENFDELAMEPWL
jgi:hypothetical protein